MFFIIAVKAKTFFVTFNGLDLICLFLRGCLVPAELFAALQHTVTRLQIIGHRLHTNHYIVLYLKSLSNK